jgi:hypothetical protein
MVDNWDHFNQGVTLWGALEVSKQLWIWVSQMHLSKEKKSFALKDDKFLTWCKLFGLVSCAWSTQLGYDDILVLSLGTGQQLQSYETEQVARWGASADMVDYNLSIIFKSEDSSRNYLRIQVTPTCSCGRVWMGGCRFSRIQWINVQLPDVEYEHTF